MFDCIIVVVTCIAMGYGIFKLAKYMDDKYVESLIDAEEK